MPGVVANLLRRLARYGAPWSKADVGVAHKLVRVVWGFVKNKWTDFFVQHTGQWIVFQYSSDSTPLMVRHRIASKTSLWQVTRKPKSKMHFLVEKCFAASNRDNVCLYGPPTQIPNTTVDIHFSQLRRFTRLPCEMGHDDMNVHVFVFDGALHSGMRRRVRQLSRPLEVSAEASVSEGAAFRQWCTNLFLFQPCISHAAHSAFKNALHDMISDPEVMKATRVTFEALRVSTGFLHEHFPAWVATVVSYEDGDSDAIRHAWSLLGLRDEWLDLASFLQVRWQDGRLNIASRFADKGVLEYVLILASKIWRFRSWSDSRWATIGASGRTLVGCALLGLEGLVRFISESTFASMYHLSGYVRHCSPRVMELSALVCTACSRPITR